jgi:hypothetical protein
MKRVRLFAPVGGNGAPIHPRFRPDNQSKAAIKLSSRKFSCSLPLHARSDSLQPPRSKLKLLHPAFKGIRPGSKRPHTLPSSPINHLFAMAYTNPQGGGVPPFAFSRQRTNNTDSVGVRRKGGNSRA